MSRVGVDKFLYRAKVDSEFRRRFAEAPETALNDFTLSDDEVRLIVTKNMGELLRRGANPLLLRRWAGLIGVDYQAALRAGGLTAEWVRPH